ncbi:chalcone isomerase family protein [bacterium]|nr:chalcone isomerase family protein [bacterium]
MLFRTLALVIVLSSGMGVSEASSQDQLSKSNVITQVGQERCLKEVCLSEEIELPGGKKLSLHSAQRYRFWGFSVYTVAVYHSEGGTNRELKWRDGDVALLLTYHRALARNDFVESGTTLLKKNPAFTRDKGMEKVFREFNTFITPVEEGDTYLLLSERNGGLALFRNGAFAGSVSDREFATLYLGMWIGEYPVRESHRDSLLHGEFG